MKPAMLYSPMRNQAKNQVHADRAYRALAIVVSKVGDRTRFTQEVVECANLTEVKELSVKTRRSVELYVDDVHQGWLRVDTVKGKPVLHEGPCTAHLGRSETECSCLIGK